MKIFVSSKIIKELNYCVKYYLIGKLRCGYGIKIELYDCIDRKISEEMCNLGMSYTYAENIALLFSDKRVLPGDGRDIIMDMFEFAI